MSDANAARRGEEGNSSRQDRAPLKERTKEIVQTGLPLDLILPLESPDGVLFKEYATFCLGCKTARPPSQTRCVHTTPFKDLHVIEGVTVCPDCNMATPFLVRFHPDGSIQGPHPVTQRWMVWKPTERAHKHYRPTPWWDLFALLRRVGRFLRI